MGDREQLRDQGRQDSPAASEVTADSLELLFELSVDLLCVADTDGYFRLVNPAFTRVLGHDKEELLSRPFQDFIHPEDVERTIREVSRLGSAGSTVDFENRYLCKDGGYVWLQWNARSIGEDQIYCVARDVTEQRRNISLMRETQAAAKIGGWELDLKTDDLYWTEQTYILHEVDPEAFDLNLEAAVQFYAPESLKIITQAVADAHESGKPWDLELEIVTAKGNRRSVRAVGRVEFLAGEPVRAFGSFQDITARKQLEEQLLHSQKLEGMGRLAGGVAHDFNNLLTVIVGNVGLVQQLAKLDEEARLSLDAVQEAANQACHVTGQLLAFARRQIRNPKYVCLANRVEELRNVLERLLGVELRLTADVSQSQRTVLIDPGHFELVLINLAVNAKDATGPGGQIAIEVRDIDGRDARGGANLTGDVVEVVVRGNGTGIRSDLIPHLFEPFFTTKGQGKGTGLGLATSHGVVEQNGGSIHVESTQGEGSAFYLYFPAADAAPSDEIVDGAIDGMIEAGSQTVLLIEDEELVRNVAAGILRKAGYQVIEAEDGPAALQLASRMANDIDAVVSDIMLPGMNGREVVRALREHLGQVPVLFVSGYSGEPMRDEDLELEGAQFLQKPFTPMQLASHVTRLIEARTSAVG